MNTNMTGFRWFSEIFASLCLDESSLCIGIWVKCCCPHVLPCAAGCSRWSSVLWVCHSAAAAAAAASQGGEGVPGVVLLVMVITIQQ